MVVAWSGHPTTRPPLVEEPQMTITLRALTHGAVAMAALGFACCADAQTTADAARSVVGSGARAGQSFIGVAVGRASYGTSCGQVAGLTCSRSTTSYSITAGNMITRNVGVELSAMNLGRVDRAGGSVSARGINLAAVGRVPLGDSVGLSGKVGATYGITHVSAVADAGLPSGRDKGLGLGYGVALDVNVIRGIHGAVGWEQHDFHFAGQGTSKVKNVTLALGYTF
jgi:OOP family OmpA-OmpF porin